MNQLLSFGKYLFAIPFAIFGILHFMNAGAMAGMAPFGGAFIIYLTGAAMLAAAVSIFIGKYDKLATALLGVLLILFVLFIHVKGMMNAADEMASAMSLTALLKDLALAGAAWMYAAYVSKDKSVIN